MPETRRSEAGECVHEYLSVVVLAFPRLHLFSLSMRIDLVRLLEAAALVNEHGLFDALPSLAAFGNHSATSVDESAPSAQERTPPAFPMVTGHRP